MSTKRLFWVMVVVCLAVSGVAVAEKKAEPEYADGDLSVMLEAFVVEVSLDALAEAGAGPLEQEDGDVTIQKIAWCLRNKDYAKVIAGAKLLIKNREEAESSEQKNVYIKRPHVSTVNGKPKTSYSYNDYTISKQFRASAAIKINNDITCEYQFTKNGINENQEDANIPPETIRLQWEGYATLKSGELEIVGSVQDEETAKFLIFSASIRQDKAK